MTVWWVVGNLGSAFPLEKTNPSYSRILKYNIFTYTLNFFILGAISASATVVIIISGIIYEPLYISAYKGMQSVSANAPHIRSPESTCIIYLKPVTIVPLNGIAHVLLPINLTKKPASPKTVNAMI